MIIPSIPAGRIHSAKWPLVLSAVLLGLWLGPVSRCPARDTGESVIVVYNRNLKESKEVADHYAKLRSVPASQVFGLDLPTKEAITREEYLQNLQRPLTKALVESGIWGDIVTNANGITRLGRSKIRYAALCYGVPVKVVNDLTVREPNADKIPETLRRTDCAVDSQMCLLSWGEKAPWMGIVPNRYYGVTNDLYMHPTNGVLLVTRLDGPSAAVAKGLVDKALMAETNGLWGRAYFDARGLTNGPYALGDQWISTSAKLLRQLGFETTLDETAITFTTGYPLSHVAFYAGWYDESVSGPFTRPTVEFVPGAFAYHLHSFSAQVLRSATERWVGPLLAKGVTATMGCVEEPYLGYTPDIHTFFGRLVFFGNTFGEAAYACQNSLSWQVTVVGDPLYQPFWQPTDKLEKQLQARGSDLVAWSNLMEANQNLAHNADKQVVIKFLQKSAFRHSAILQEKVASLFLEQNRFNLAAETYEEVLKVATSPGQRVRVLYALGELRSNYGPDTKAYEAYLTILKENPDYPEKAVVYQKLVPLARRLGKRTDEEGFTKELNKLTGKAN